MSDPLDEGQAGLAIDDSEQLAGLLTAWLPGQRWFGGKDRPVDAVRVVRDAAIPAEGVRVHHLLVAVTQGGDEVLYQVPVSLRPHAEDRLEHVHIGHVGGAVVYDALHDKEATAALLRRFEGDPVPGLEFTVEPDAEIPYGESSIVLSGEQSNTSLVFGDAAILKVFRRIEEGPNPDIEVHDALTRAGSTHVAALLAWVEGTWPDARGSGEHRGALMMLQRFLVTATDGWSLAAASVRDLYAEADLHADEVGGDFAAESRRLGAATAEVHALMASTLDTGERDAAGNAEVARAMHRRLDAALAVVADLAPFSPGLREAFDALASLPDAVPVQRIHGDFHLGQVMRTVVGWKLLDFEGEPAKPLAERRALDSPVRDVAGMLRSFDYAARLQMLTDHPGDAQIAYRAAEWSQRNRDAFLDGYAEVSGRDVADDAVLLRAYETDKVVYEVVYEARNRPRWLPIPMTAVERLAAGEPFVATASSAPPAPDGGPLS
jgi:maltokinase